jgi:hypothetical protein
LKNMRISIAFHSNTLGKSSFVIGLTKYLIYTYKEKCIDGTTSLH